MERTRQSYVTLLENKKFYFKLKLLIRPWPNYCFQTADKFDNNTFVVLPTFSETGPWALGGIIMFSERDLLFRIPEHSILEGARGGFAKQVWVLSGGAPNQPGALDFLSKVLTAARLNLERDTLFVDVSGHAPLSILPALKEKPGEYILVFGLTPAEIGLAAEIPRYIPYPFYGSTFLFADALATLEPDKVLKGKLWQALQQIFL